MADKTRAGSAKPGDGGADGVARMAPGRDGKWAREIIALQEDGLWGNFHTLSAPQRGASITTEQALRRLMVWGMRRKTR